MSLTKTFMLAQGFEVLVRKIYEANGFTVLQESKPAELGFDMLLKSPSNQTIVVETKVSRSRTIPRATIIKMIDHVNQSVAAVGAAKGILVLAGYLGIPIQKSGSVEVVDINRLSEMAATIPELIEELASIGRELAPPPVGDFDDNAFRIFGDAYMAGSYTSRVPFGETLISSLRSVPTGRRGARKFEEVCFDAIKYIFESDFSNWSKQKVSDGGLTRFDVIARISSEHDFWKSIVVYFRSWYVVFEFKNYTKRVSQAEVITTERYLFPKAMRTIAIIISRKGADKNAVAVTRGAVREAGKLVIHLSIDDLFKLLRLKDHNDDPNSFLFDNLDEMLMKLER